jgi:protease-4
MKTKLISIILLFFLSASCSVHFHLDLLGKETMEEVILLKSAAKEKILMIDVEGLISSLPSSGLFAREGDLLSQIYYRLDKASEDPLVQGIILRLDTPGGEVTASDIIYNEIMKFKQKTKRPVVGLMMGTAASGGYYIASACNYIIAHPSTITGSIGVISIFPSVQELLTKIGVKMSVIKSGEMKDSGSSLRDLTEEEKKVFQGIIDELYQNFLDVVYKSRKNSISLEELKKMADGRVYTAQQALKLKLIDEIGYFDRALEKALSLASLRQAKVIAYSYYPKTKTNIYAMSLQNTSLLKENSFEKLLPSLKTGFYYLWLPQMER